MIKKIALSLATVSIVGCATMGREFASDLNWIKEGSTKQKDVRLVLGDPYQVGNSSGTITWTYGFYKYSLMGQSYSKELKFYWKSSGEVDRFNFTSSFPTDLATTKN